MTFEGILGQDASIGLLRRALERGRLPAALLFQGPEGVGKATVARALAATLLCERAAVDACGVCAECRRLQRGSHPDFFLVERLPKGAMRSRGRAMADEDEEGEGPRRSERSPFIVVDQIRELCEHAAYAPLEARNRVFVIDPADRMNAESQNALLKTLEEPPAGSYLVLVASRPHLLLPTVRSRCLAVRFPPMEPGALARALASRGIAGEDALARAALGEGCPGRALALDLPQLVRRRDEALEALIELGSRGAAAGIPALAARLFGKDESSLLQGLDLFEALLRDAARLAAGAETVLHADRTERLRALSGRLDPSLPSSLVGAAERLRRESRFNLNRTLVAESLLAAVAGGPVP